MAIMLKMSLGGKGFNHLKPCCYCYNHPATNRRLSYKLSSRRNIQSVTCCSDSSLLTVYLKNKTYKLEEGAEEGFNTDNKEMPKQSYEKGDIINLPDMLFTKNRDYLVKNNNEQVKAKQLEGKVIVIFFVPTSGCEGYLKWLTLSLMEIYSDCKLNNNFEVVSIPVGVDPSLIGDGHSLKSPEDLFSLMPWPSIPMSDITSRQCLQRSFGVSRRTLPIAFIIDPTGRVLQKGWHSFDIYGSLGYPFSDERINFLEAEDQSIAKHPSLKALLASPQRDYLISSDGEEVPIHSLEDKVVVLLFYEEGFMGYYIIEELRKAYQRFAKVEHNFEVVLIYQSGTFNTRSTMNEKLFWAMFKTMPWLALPFNDPNHKRLRRIFEHSYLFDKENPLQVVIFGPRGEFIEPFGTLVLCTYGIEAFPFTRMEAAKFETEKVKELQLGMLWDQNTIFRRKDGSQIRFSQLSGKQVMLYYERAHMDSEDFDFLQILKEKYLQMKGTDEEFEVIHVLESSDSVYLPEYIRCQPDQYSRQTTESLASFYIGDLPWLVSVETKLLPAEFGSYLCFKDMIMNTSVLFAFDRDGKLVRKTMYPTVEDARFPFYAGDLEEEALTDLTTFFSWDYTEDCEKWRILSYKDFRIEEQDDKENVDPKHGDAKKAF